jgi:hypothetical protein
MIKGMYRVGLGACAPGNSGVAHAVLANDATAACGEALEIVLPLRMFDVEEGQCKVCLEAVDPKPGLGQPSSREQRRAVLAP